MQQKVNSLLLKYTFFITCVFISFGNKAQEVYTIERTISELLEANYGIKIMKNEAVIAVNNNNIGNAGYLPTINLIAEKYWSAYNTRQEFFSGQVNEADPAKSNSTNAALQLNWTLFDGFRMFAVDKRLDLQESLAAMQVTSEMEMTIYQATVQFYTLLQLQKLNEVYLESIELSNARFNQQKLKRNLGAASEVQLVQAKIDLFADSSVLLNNQREINLAKANLNYLLGKESDFNFSIEGSLNDIQVLEWQNMLTSAQAQNSNLLINKANIAIRDQEIKEVRSNYYPQLSVFGQYVYTQSQNQVGILNSSRAYGSGVGITLSWNILSNLSNYTNLKNAKIIRESAELQLNDESIFIETELRKSFSDYEFALKNLRLEQQNIEELGVNLEIARNAYENGALTDLELREFQFSVVQAQIRYLQAQLQQKTAELNLRVITGDFKQLL